MADSFVLRIGGFDQSFDSLKTLDGAFSGAVRTAEFLESDVQIEANVYLTPAGGCQTIGRTHAYRLDDGRVFRRPLAGWAEAQLVQTGIIAKMAVSQDEMVDVLERLSDKATLLLDGTDGARVLQEWRDLELLCVQAREIIATVRS